MINSQGNFQPYRPLIVKRRKAVDVEMFEPVSDDDTDLDDEGPCCYGWVTSKGSVHEIDCPRYDGIRK